MFSHKKFFFKRIKIKFILDEKKNHIERCYYEQISAVCSAELKEHNNYFREIIMQETVSTNNSME